VQTREFFALRGCQRFKKGRHPNFLDQGLDPDFLNHALDADLLDELACRFSLADPFDERSNGRMQSLGFRSCHLFDLLYQFRVQPGQRCTIGLPKFSFPSQNFQKSLELLRGLRLSLALLEVGNAMPHLPNVPLE